MKNITVILPIHTLEGDYKKMFSKAVESVEEFHDNVSLLIVGPKNAVGDLQKGGISDKLDVKIHINDGDTGFCSQINIGIENCTTEWFSILEVDDEYTKNWLSSFENYKELFSDVDIYLPIVKDVNTEGKVMNFTNESVWAYGFTETQGILDNEVLLEYQNYQTSGGIYKTDVIKENGSFKENIKLTFSYEFLLRMTHNGVKITTIPQIGYRHVNFREDSLFWSYKNNENTKLANDEAKFWLETAKKEFFFKNKRDVEYDVK
jgi:glycosyltransferase involved in cell wall biosynthesis